MEGRKISILGCGWLGITLLQRLIEYGCEVKGSTTTERKLKTIKGYGATPYLLDLDKLDVNILKLFLAESGVLIINIPPRRKIKEVKSYSKVLEGILPFLNNDQKVIFISSTSVYQNTNNWVDESFDLYPETDSGMAVLNAEKCLKDDLGERLTILRFAGLIGKDRHPGAFLAGRKDLLNGNAPINMIHQEDCIGLILEVIKKEFWGEVINGVTSEHPLRKDFYTQATQALGLEEPTFQEENVTIYKLISNVKSVNQLGYTYLHDNPMEVI
ncbi:SDR family NAD(P)-dependent oxidoreductase [Pseudofulvibacter geojedonensis]|uniref:SDR family NAD(P)-dependent oxidoreductase n=1 Tax=Pseudofulvibacter geojedonensis TaxID=1123758 RepID=A0ABW3I5L5_9FLAO